MSRHRARILHVGPLPPPTDGGIAAYLDGLLASELSTRYELVGFDVRVPPRAQRIRPLRAWTAAGFVQGFARALQAHTPDLVHIHTSARLSFWEKSLLGRLAGRRGIPWILHLHDGDFEPFLRELRQPLAGWARAQFHGAAAVVSVCASWTGWLEAWVPPARLHHIPNAIHLDGHGVAAAAGCGSIPRLVFLGDPTVSKGLWDLLDALAQLRRQGLDFVLDVLGGTPAQLRDPGLLRRLRQDGLRQRVHLHGRCYGDSKRRRLSQADVFVLPSHRESFCIANLEAMACGLPVVSTRTGAIPEVVRHGRDGLLVDIGDVERLAQALGFLLRDSDERRRMGASARARAARYDWNRVGPEIAALYDGLLPETRATATAAAVPTSSPQRRALR